MGGGGGEGVNYLGGNYSHIMITSTLPYILGVGTHTKGQNSPKANFFQGS